MIRSLLGGVASGLLSCATAPVAKPAACYGTDTDVGLTLKSISQQDSNWEGFTVVSKWLVENPLDHPVNVRDWNARLTIAKTYEIAKVTVDFADVPSTVGAAQCQVVELRSHVTYPAGSPVNVFASEAEAQLAIAPIVEGGISVEPHHASGQGRVELRQQPRVTLNHFEVMTGFPATAIAFNLRFDNPNTFPVQLKGFTVTPSIYAVELRPVKQAEAATLAGHDFVQFELKLPTSFQSLGGMAQPALERREELSYDLKGSYTIEDTDFRVGLGGMIRPTYVK